VNFLVFISHPRKSIISMRKAFALSFLIEAILTCCIGSLFPAFGQNWSCNAIVMHCYALCTIALFDSESNKQAVPSSIYPSVPPLNDIGSWTSVSNAGPNGTSLLNLFGGGISFFSWLGSLLGSHRGKFSKSFARSNVMSELFENAAGAGIEPKGNRPRATAISSSSGVWSSLWFCTNYIAMHLAVIFAEVWRRL